MTIAVFTSNQPRHIALIEALASIADVVYAVQECNTVFPGQVADFFRKSDVMQRYFARVTAAEEEVFGGPRFAPANVRQLPVKMNDLNSLNLQILEPALASNYIIVFGASYIKGDLCRRLVQRRAVNIHMGVSPYYRGSSTNFWAMYDRQPQFVGATIHLLSEGLDSGNILFHALPGAAAVDPFVYGMHAVRAAQSGLVAHIKAGDLFDLTPRPQDRALELRYTRNADFTDEVAADYLARLPSAADMRRLIAHRDDSLFLRPFIC
jgi:folate-dependent phosphoribosylglycinamide formyltransferase PurN